MRRVHTVDGLAMLCDTRDFVPRRIAYFGVYEHALTEAMRERVQPGDTVLDVGANVGYFTLLAGRLVGPAGRVVAVEADPDMHDKLTSNVALNHDLPVQTRQVAVTEARCRVAMRTHDRKNLGANYTAIAPNGDIEGVPLIEAVGAEALDAAAFVKVDIEGAEGPVFDAILGRLDRMSPRLTMAAELVEKHLPYLDRFRDAGFAVHRLANSYDIEDYLAHRWGRPMTEGHGNAAGDYLLTRGPAAESD